MSFSFFFNSQTSETVSDYIKKERKKPFQDNIIPVNLIKGSISLLSHFIFHNSNNLLFSSRIKRSDFKEATKF